MAVVTSAVTMAASTTGGTSVTTSSFTPAQDDLLVLLAGFTDLTRPAPAVVVTKSIVAAPGFVPIRQAFYRTSLDTICMFVGGGLESPTARTVTLTFPASVSGTFWGVYRVSGMQRTGQGAVRQSAIQNNGAIGTAAPVFPAACLTGNPVIAVFGNGSNPAAVTEPSGFTETIDTGYATPTSGFEAVFRNTGFTGSTLTWGGASASAFGAMAVELDTRPWTGNDEPQFVRSWT